MESTGALQSDTQRVAAWLNTVGDWTRTERCSWVTDDLLAYYHDLEWGHAPETDEKWFEFIVLETFQAGLSWKTILHKRTAFRQAFQQFDYEVVRQFGEDDIARLMANANIVRNRKKIVAAIENAQIAAELSAQYGSLANFMNGLRNRSDLLSTLQRTFRFVGKTTAESIAFATGLMTPPHDEHCSLRGMV